MNDNELIAAVRQSFTGVHSATPLEQIMTRSRRLRARRRIPGIAAALAVTAGVAVAVTALLPASHHPSSPPGIQLAAWTVVKQADGRVSVTIRELSDPAGLQRKLRAEGIPASVTAARRHQRLIRLARFRPPVPRPPFSQAACSSPGIR